MKFAVRLEPAAADVKAGTFPADAFRRMVVDAENEDEARAICEQIEARRAAFTAWPEDLAVWEAQEAEVADENSTRERMDTNPRFKLQTHRQGEPFAVVSVIATVR